MAYACPLPSTVYTGPPESPLTVQDPDVFLATAMFLAVVPLS
ncbi:hypothetical protein BN2537_17035 [Streptomyces venezuelae]|nr:hypothetical protein BN2537_17035 [Streptomyces venezuelae]